MKETLRITLVDDDAIFCFIFKKYLEKYSNKNIDLTVFPDGYSAAEYFRKNKNNEQTFPQVLFIDINMPLMNGWELMDTIRLENLFENQKVKSYFISSSISKADQSNRKNSYYNIPYLTKPINHFTLFEVLDNFGYQNIPPTGTEELT